MFTPEQIENRRRWSAALRSDKYGTVYPTFDVGRAFGISNAEELVLAKMNDMGLSFGEIADAIDFRTNQGG